MDIKIRNLKILGKVELNPITEVEMDKEITIVGKGQIVKIEEGSNQDGSVNRTYVLKLADVVISEG